MNKFDNQKPNRKRVKPGDVLAIPLSQNAIAVGLVLHVSKKIRNGIMVGFFNQLFPSFEDIKIEKLENSLIYLPNYTGKQPVFIGRWKVIGNNQDLLASIEIPILYSGDNLYYKDEQIKQPYDKNVEDYPILSVAGETALENQLRQYFFSSTNI